MTMEQQSNELGLELEGDELEDVQGGCHKPPTCGYECGPEACCGGGLPLCHPFDSLGGLNPSSLPVGTLVFVGPNGTVTPVSPYGPSSYGPSSYGPSSYGPSPYAPSFSPFPPAGAVSPNDWNGALQSLLGNSGFTPTSGLGLTPMPAPAPGFLPPGGTIIGGPAPAPFTPGVAGGVISVTPGYAPGGLGFGGLPQF